MSWFTRAFTIAVPFIADVFETRDLKQSGDKMFGGLAARLKEIADDPVKVRELAGALEEKKGELTGAIVARTPAAGLLDPQFMPPGSTNPTQEQVVIPDPAPAADPLPAETATEAEEYEYDDSEEDEGEDVANAPKAKKKKKK